MEVFKIHRIVQDLVNIGLQDSCFPNLKLDTEDNTFKEQHHINSFTESRDFILEYHLTIAVSITRERILHNGDFAFPRLYSCCACLSVIMLNELSENRHSGFIQKP